MGENFNLTKDTSTLIKGMACLLIVLHHWCGRLSGMGYSNVIIDLISLRGGVTGVTIFFFLSSYGLARSQRLKRDSPQKFFTKRLVKVYIPLVITNLIWLIIRYQGQSFGQSVLQVLNFEPVLDCVTWFCNVIIACYMIFYICDSFRKPWIKILSNWLLTFIVAAFLVKMWPDAPFYVYSLVAFPLGAMLATLQDKMSAGKLLAITFVPSILLLAFLVFICLTYRNQLIANIYCCAVILFLALIALNMQRGGRSSLYGILNPIARLFYFLGIYSYEIYLLHAKVLSIGGSYHLTIWYPILFIVIVIPLSICLYELDTRISKRIVEK